MDVLYYKYFYLKEESSKNARIHIVICFTPSKLTFMDSPQTSTAT